MSDHKKLLQKNHDDAYQFLVEKKLRPREEGGESVGHSHGDELSKLRKEIVRLEQLLYITPSEEFAEYNRECEQAKQEAREIIGVSGESDE